MPKLCMQCRKCDAPVMRDSWATPVCFTCVRPRPWEQTRSAAEEESEEERGEWLVLMDHMANEDPTT